jgi:peroxiredoxin
MRKILSIAALAILFFACNQTPKFTIDGTIEGLEDGTVYLKQRVAGNSVTIDSTTSTGGKFSLTGTVEVPDIYYISSGEKFNLSLIVENSKIHISGKADDMKNITITGSVNQDEYKGLETKAQEVGKQMRDLYSKYSEARKANDSITAGLLEKQLDSLDQVQSAIYKNFVTGNPASFVSPVILQRIQYGMEADELKSYLGKFSPEVLKSKSAKSLTDRVTVLQSVEVGKIAPEFTMNDSIGNPVKLSDIYSKNELTLVDFWASWCGPCRRENPNVVKTWNEYNKKGFTVLGVSCDNDKAKWLKAISDDKLTWNHVSDLKGWGNEAAKLYGVNSIPSNLLLDKTGKIIAKNLREEKLGENIAEILK